MDQEHHNRFIYSSTITLTGREREALQRVIEARLDCDPTKIVIGDQDLCYEVIKRLVEASMLVEYPDQNPS